MTTEANKWLDIKVKPTVPGAQINRLDDHLTQSLPAAVIQHLKAGKRSYQADENGEFTVRCHVPSLLGFTKIIIEHNAFEATSAKEMPEGKDIKIKD